jgi:molybdopterin converting factor small subunit
MAVLTLTVPASLATLAGSGAERGGGSARSVRLDASDWAGAVAEIRARFPRLAERVLTGCGRVRPGFVLVVNDVITPAQEIEPAIRAHDEVVLLAQIAGG